MKCILLHMKRITFLFSLFYFFFYLHIQAEKKYYSLNDNHESANTTYMLNNTGVAVDSNDILPYALIAGGSRGIGYAISEALAKRGYNLILIARGMQDLVEAKDKIEKSYPVKVHVLSFDLSKEASATEIAKWCTDNNIKLKMLCNVAGLGGDEDYLELSLDSLRYMINLNLQSAMALSLTLLPLLEKNAPSHILNVSSMAGFAPIPSKNMYSATKAALTSFSYALRYQLKSKNISVSCLAPGPVYTKPSIKEQTKKQLGWFGNAMAMKPERVGEIAVKKTLRGKLMVVPGTLANIMSGVLRILPKRFVTYIYGRSGDKTKRKEAEKNQ